MDLIGGYQTSFGPAVAYSNLWVNFAFKMMNSAFKMMDFAFKW